MNDKDILRTFIDALDKSNVTAKQLSVLVTLATRLEIPIEEAFEIYLNDNSYSLVIYGLYHNKIKAIKAYRCLHSVGLKEAKDFIETNAKSSQDYFMITSGSFNHCKEALNIIVQSWGSGYDLELVRSNFEIIGT